LIMWSGTASVAVLVASVLITRNRSWNSIRDIHENCKRTA